jgi:hypothetical protein
VRASGAARTGHDAVRLLALGADFALAEETVGKASTWFVQKALRQSWIRQDRQQERNDNDFMQQPRRHEQEDPLSRTLASQSSQVLIKLGANRVALVELELFQLSCSRCDYKADLLVGTQEPAQTLSDLNEDFAYYRLFLCPEGNDIQSMDIHFREFDGNCPQHGVELQSLADMPRTCPKCGGPIRATKKGILKPQKGE